eukprot:s941_g4.t2
MLIWDKQQGDLLEELQKTCEATGTSQGTAGQGGVSFDADDADGLKHDLADAVDRAEWMEQSQNKKPAAKKMPKPKKMPESPQRPGPTAYPSSDGRCSGAMRPPEPERPPSFLAPTVCKASAPPPPVAWPIIS